MKKMMLSIMGIQGCGKGTQSKRIANEFGIAHLSTGDIFRSHIEQNTDFGQKIKKYLDEGTLVPDDFVVSLLQSEIKKNDCGFILDGFPRNVSQAKYLLKKYALSKVIFMDLKKKVAIRRISARQRCENCDIDYSQINKPEKKDVCNKCGGVLQRRADDEPDAIKVRLEKYFVETAPLFHFFEDRNLLFKIDADQSPDVIFEQIKRELEKI